MILLDCVNSLATRGGWLPKDGGDEGRMIGMGLAEKSEVESSSGNVTRRFRKGKQQAWVKIKRFRFRNDQKAQSGKAIQAVID